MAVLLAFPFVSWAAGGAQTDGGHNVGLIFLWLAVILLAAKVGSLLEHFGQPVVLGEILIGVILGNLYFLGFNWLEPVRDDALIKFLAEFGVVILLFQIGLESNITQMWQVGPRALLVAILGVILPFALGAFLIGPWLIPDLSFNSYLFLGAALTATSVGITARVFKDLGKLKTNEAQIVLGAAVIDDVLGLIILAVVSAMVTLGSISLSGIALITLEAFLFLAAAIYLGSLAAPYLGRWFSKIHSGVGMKFTLALSFCLFMAYLAEKIGLAPIVGAFAAGLVLDPVHFQYFKDNKLARELKDLASHESEDVKQRILTTTNHHSRRHIEDLIEPLAFFLVPIFFVMTGFSVDLRVLFDLPVLGVALAVSIFAFLSKLATGLVAGKKVNKWIVGLGMVPRGEVGLIFAMIGKGLGVIDDRLFSIIVIMVIITTLLTPPILTMVLKKQGQETGDVA